MSQKIFIALSLLALSAAVAAPVCCAKDIKDIDVSLRASAGASYDDNITFAESDAKSDLITTLSVGATATAERKRTIAQLKANLTQQLFSRYTRNHNTAEDATLTVRHEISKFDTLTISDTFSHADEPRSFEEEFTRTRGRYSYLRNRFDIAYEREFTQQAAARIGFGYDVDQASASDLTDSELTRGFLEGIYAFSSKNQALARFDLSSRRLKPGGTADIQTASLGMRHFFSEMLSLEGRAGMDFIDSYDGRDYSKPLLLLSLIDQPDELTQITLFSFSKRYSTSPSTSDIFDSWRISSGLTRQLAKRLSGSANIFFGSGEYASLKIEEDFYGVGLGIGYELDRDTRLEFSYSYSQTSSNIRSMEYRKNVISGRVSRQF